MNHSKLLMKRPPLQRLLLQKALPLRRRLQRLLQQIHLPLPLLPPQQLRQPALLLMTLLLLQRLKYSI